MTEATNEQIRDDARATLDIHRGLAELLPDVADRIADRVAERIHGGILAIPADTQDRLKEFAGFYCPSMRVGWGPASMDIQGLVTRDGALELQLRDQFGTTVWRGQLRAEVASVADEPPIEQAAQPVAVPDGY